jgi:hypothetical protein
MTADVTFGGVAIYVDDVARAVAEGAEPVVEPRAMPWGGGVAYVRSIEGTLIVLCTPPKDS